MAFTATRYAVRSVGRNARRTALSVAGIAVGCALALLTESFNRGKDEIYARAGAESGSGHLRIVPAGWRERRDPRLRLADGAADLAAARALPGVIVAVPRARAQVLLALGTHVAPVELVGVEPGLEPRAYRFVRKVAQGRYLSPGDEPGTVVLGKALAERLGVEVGDEVFVTAVGKGGSIQSGLLRLVGIVATGSEDIDAGICQVPLPEVERITGVPGPGEVTTVLSDWRAAEAARRYLQARVAPGDEVMTWTELSPEFAGHLQQDTAVARLVTGIVLLIVGLGVASAQLAAVLERRREFAVLAALGMGTGRMVRLVLQEALVLGLSGAALGLAAAAPLVRGFARAGLDFSRWMGASWSFQGVIVEPIVYGAFGFWMVPEAFAIGLGATMLASLYPAWFAARTDPAVALRALP